MVRRVVGLLLGRSKGDDAWRATALTYLRAGQNVDATAERRYVHPDTVRHRITRDAAVLVACLARLEAYGADGLGSQGRRPRSRMASCAAR
ncbi:helix-turn-helix domain-containing protein [Nocardioides sp. L-11A]|uniref:helix-turn-helix domain-containing protein n=1 Tax=Nocardioides sp. L-11A TaxID=3043848 RepID=UPI00249C4EBD|nr:helix-turn-helix domain-containing protein [Nocardioides sp. L-11A]